MRLRRRGEHRTVADRFLGYEWQTLSNPDGTLFAVGYLAAVFAHLGPLRITGGPEWSAQPWAPGPPRAPAAAISLCGALILLAYLYFTKE